MVENTRIVSELEVFLDNWSKRAHDALAADSQLERGALLNDVLTDVTRLRLSTVIPLYILKFEKP